MTHAGEFLQAERLELGPTTDAAPEGNWRFARDGERVAWLVLDRPGSAANTVSAAVLRELDAHLDALEADLPAALVIRSAKPGGFAMGADLDDLASLPADEVETLLRRGHGVLDRLAALDCPTVAVIHGAALGAGLELALACDARIAVDGASAGFPEVRLGLHPGLGGTVRLPALIAPDEAMTLMLTGKTAHTRKARRLGLFDEITQERHVRAAIAKAMLQQSDQSRGLRGMALETGAGRALAARRMRARTQDEARPDHYPAPHRLIDLWESHGGDPDAMQEAEIASFAKLLETDSARNLMRVFFLRQHLKRAGAGESGIERVHVVGAGEMGAGIAAWAALKGARVTLGDLSNDALGAALRRAVETCEKAHLGPAATRDALDRLMPDPRGYGTARADLVIEAVPEDPDLKHDIHAGLGREMKPDAILATNTSSLRLTDLARAVAAPARFAGLHFFNPVSRMQLVEVVGHDGTDPAVLDRLSAFCTELDRLPVRVSDAPGFLVNRALMPYLIEALVLMQEGIAKETIDRAALEFGMPMGPVTLADQVGLDICLDVAHSLSRQLDKPMPEIPDRLRELVEQGHTGKKAGRGFYDWSDGPPEPGKAESGAAPDDLTDRLILPMCDACVECLRRQVVRDEDDIDAAMIFATGFAPFRGGPMRYARSLGPAAARDRLAALAEAHGERFRPDEGWRDLD